MKFLFIIIVSLILGAFSSCWGEPNSAHLQTLGGLKHKFEELPGFFVEFSLKIPCSEDEDDEVCADGYKRVAFCSGTHIGGGYVVTAAHCVNELLDGCSSSFHHIGEVGVRVLVAGDAGQHEPRLIPFSQVQGAVYHAGYSTAEMMDDYDLALLRLDPKIPFAGEAELPGDDDFSVKKLQGALWVYGVGSKKSLQDQEMVYRQQFLQEDYYGGLAYVDRIKEQQNLSEEEEEILEQQFVDEITPVIEKGTLHVRDQEFKDLLREMIRSEEDPKKEDLKELSSKLWSMGSDEISPRHKAFLSALFMALYDGGHSHCEGEVQGEGENRFGEDFVVHNSAQDGDGESSETSGLSSEDVSGGVLEKPEVDSYLNYFSAHAGQGEGSTKQHILSVCQGDSGGPVLKKMATGFTLVAVSGATTYREYNVQNVMAFLLSMGMSSCGGVSSLASSVNVHAHMDWIKAAQRAIEQGGYRIPDHLTFDE